MVTMGDTRYTNSFINKTLMHIDVAKFDCWQARCPSCQPTNSNRELGSPGACKLFYLSGEDLRRQSLR